MCEKGREIDIEVGLWVEIWEEILQQEEFCFLGFPISGELIQQSEKAKGICNWWNLLEMVLSCGNWEMGDFTEVGVSCFSVLDGTKSTTVV
jgi:hypothetical protein